MKLIRASIIATIFEAATASQKATQRSLQSGNSGQSVVYQKIAGYQPLTLVTSINAIDLDQKLFETQLNVGAQPNYTVAVDVYNLGAFADPFAELELVEPLANTLEVGDSIVGFTTGGRQEVHGRVMADYPKGTTVIRVRYDAEVDQERYVGCRVGSNPDPKTGGCFAQEGKVIVSLGKEGIGYFYDILQGNKNGISLKGLSTEARERMYLCTKGCPYDDFEKFVTYYGVFEYADQWITAAGEGGKTTFENGGADFSEFAKPGRYEAMKVGTVFLSTFMEVIGRMEGALDDCGYATAVKSWDEAVAFYTGSLEGKAGTDNGVLLYSWADKRCLSFNTCGPTGKGVVGTSFVNLKIFEQFTKGQKDLMQGNCEGAKASKKRIVQLMLIPQIQSAIRTTYLHHSGLDKTKIAEAQGATSAAAVLPYIYECSQDDARIIYNATKIGHAAVVDFTSVKEAFERNYKCLGLTCAEVGGVWDFVGQKYEDQANPCNGSSPTYRGNQGNQSTQVKTKKYSGNPNVGLAVGLAVGGAAFIALVVIISTFLGKKAAPAPQLEVQGNAESSALT